MGRKLTRNLGGRPTKMSEEVTTKLESIFKIGGNIDEAVSYAGISDETYRRWFNQNEGFVVRMKAAQHYADIAAKNVVVDAIINDRDLATAKWWLEKREFKNSNNTNVAIVGRGDMSIEFIGGDEYAKTKEEEKISVENQETEEES